ncbi:MAG: alkaline phosphatase family protein [Acetobacteraceae bacterium]|nr:alkaline phosphatase family protein [Acetobacteraceae bacterium]
MRSQPSSALAELSQHGINYSNAATTAPLDSFPGMIAQVTGSTPRSAGVFHDDSYDRTMFAPRSNCSGLPGTETQFAEISTRTKRVMTPAEPAAALAFFGLQCSASRVKSSSHYRRPRDQSLCGTQPVGCGLRMIGTAIFSSHSPTLGGIVVVPSTQRRTVVSCAPSTLASMSTDQCRVPSSSMRRSGVMVPFSSRGARPRSFRAIGPRWRGFRFCRLPISLGRSREWRGFWRGRAATIRAGPGISRRRVAFIRDARAAQCRALAWPSVRTRGRTTRQ